MVAASNKTPSLINRAVWEFGCVLLPGFPASSTESWRVREFACALARC